jgi:hypothetical protein
MSKKNKDNGRGAFNREVDAFLCKKYEITLKDLVNVETEVLEQMRSDVLFELLAE